jgi:predicted site-specific integrase-resolvase
MPNLDLPTYITITDAVRRYGIGADVLERAVVAGLIHGIRTPDNALMLNQAEVKAKARAVFERERLLLQVEPLRGQTIGVAEAREKYAIPLPTIYRWIDAGIIRVSQDIRTRGRGHKRLLDESTVAYCAMLGELMATKRGKRGQGHRIFSPDMLPPWATT